MTAVVEIRNRHGGCDSHVLSMESPHKGPVTRRAFPGSDVSMLLVTNTRGLVHK